LFSSFFLLWPLSGFIGKEGWVHPNEGKSHPLAVLLLAGLLGLFPLTAALRT